jgi:DNA-binding transcriptional MerR regulator
MSDDAGVVYTTRQAAEALGVGAAMMRRYAQTLEEITGQEIPQTRRDGRQFSREHLDTLLQAKALVDSHNGLSVEAALRMATSPESAGQGLPVSVPIGSIADSAALVAALQEAITAPLVAELRELRAEVAALRAEAATPKALPPAASAERVDRALEAEMQESQAPPEQPPTAPDDSGAKDGPMVRAAVRAARWLEGRLRGGRLGSPKE